MSVKDFIRGPVGFRTLRLLNAHGRKLLLVALVALTLLTGTAAGEDILTEPLSTEEGDDGP